ncbi:MAG: CHAP domain-containing protein [Candidatus Electrothrix sp. YB6]
MLRLKSMMCWLVLLSLAVPLGNNAWAKQPKFDVDAVSEISLDVLRIEACAARKGCVTASGPMQLNLLDLADGKVDLTGKVLLPEKTKELRLVLGENNTITVDDEPFPLITPHDLIKLKGQKIFGQEGGFLSSLTLNLNLRRQLALRKKKIGSSGKGKNRQITFMSFYKLRQNIRVQTAEVTPLTEDMAAVVALPDEENEIVLGDTFSLVIPAGAVSEPMVISVKETKYTVEVMDEETGAVVEKPALSSNYELSPDGAEFTVPLVITLPYSPETLPSDVSEYDLAVYLDEERIPTDINTMSKTATADVWHFTNATVSDSQSTGNFVFPFDERDKMWQICQGYNTDISHEGTLIHSFDFAYGSGNLGNTGCWGNSGGSEDKTVVAPAKGMILWNGTTDKDITCFQLKVPVSNGHGVQIGSVKFGHMKSNSDRKSANPKLVIAQKTPIGKLCGPTGCDSSGPYAHLHMAAYATSNCTGVTVPFGTVFGSEYDFSSDESKHQWHGTEIPPVDAPSDDDLVLKEVRVTANGTLYAGETATYTAVADLAENITTGSLPEPGDVVETIDVTDECSWLATPTMYVTSLGDGLVQANSGSAGQTVKVKCSYYHSPSNIQLTGTLPVVVSDGNGPTFCPYGNGLYCGDSGLGQNETTLYRCTDGVYSIEEQCAYGCKVMSPGVNDKCKDIRCTFPDVDQTAFYADEVNAFCSAGIVIGQSVNGENLFMPTKATNLAETLKVLIYAYDYVTTDNRPKDIEPWYSYYIAEAQKMGIEVTESMAGDEVLRSEVMDYIVKIFYGQTVADPVQFLVDEGITNGSSPDMPLNRSELVVLAYRAAEKTGTIDAIEFGKVVTSTLGDEVADRAELEIGRTISTDGNNEWVGWSDGKLITYCAVFVRVMFDKQTGKGHAYQVCDDYKTKGYMRTSGTPERGDAICYLPDSSNWGYGHIAIATGDGQEIGVTSTSKGVTVRPILKTANYYQGFIKAEDYDAHY